jgi:hypothetical protein
MGVNFYTIDEEKLLSYHYYSAQVNNSYLLELNGYKLRNLFSVVFNSSIKDYFIENLFHQNSSYLSSETKEYLYRNLSPDEVKDLKYSLSNYLDFQIESNWFSILSQLLYNESINAILIPSLILKNEFILSQLKYLFPKIKFIEWLSYDESKKTLILDYNHAWKKRNLFTIHESNYSAYFLQHFFKSAYRWKAYKYEHHLFNRMNTQTRENLFGKELITELKERLASIKPNISFSDWDILHDVNHKRSFTLQEEIVIYYSSTNCKKYRLNTSFLILKDSQFSIITAKDLVNNSSLFEGKYQYSNLENIISQININKLNNAIEKDESVHKVVQHLWSKYNLCEGDGKLWKQLLQRRAQENGVYNVYNDIERISGVKQFVSLNTFENTYCNPFNSTIIPREKKVFKAICLYLELPFEYRVAIHRERNLIGGHSQELHSNLKDLIKVIVELGVLDKRLNDNEVLDLFNENEDKIVDSVDMDFFGFTRDALVYACIEICFQITEKMNLKPIVKVEQVIPI